MFSVEDNVSLLKSTGGVAVVFNGATTYGHLDTYAGVFDPNQGNGPVATLERRLTIATGALPDLEEDEIVEVGGVEYQVLEPPMPVDDGGLTCARVRPANPKLLSNY